MSQSMRRLGVYLCITQLTACMSSEPETYTDYNTYGHDGTELYPQGYETGLYRYEELPRTKAPVVVPETYHVGAYHSPTPSKDVDAHWVNTQNPQGYTIELADGDKASEVANTMQKTPKSERTAELKYQHEGKTHYKGVYGSYPSRDAAEKALNALPPDVKQNAGITTWDRVQTNNTPEKNNP